MMFADAVLLLLVTLSVLFFYVFISLVLHSLGSFVLRMDQVVR